MVPRQTRKPAALPRVQRNQGELLAEVGKRAKFSPPSTDAASHL